MPPQQEQGNPRSARNWRFLAVVITVILLPTALVAIILTAPISEMHILIWNVDETDTAHFVFYLDGTREVGLYAGPGGSAGWVFHVPPGTHSVGVDFSYNYSYDNPHDEIIDHLWTARVEFNGILRSHLCVDSEGINTDHKYNLIDVFYLTKSPLEQAISDPYVIVPVVTLAASHVLLMVAIWNHRRTPPGRESS